MAIAIIRPLDPPNPPIPAATPAVPTVPAVSALPAEGPAARRDGGPHPAGGPLADPPGEADRLPEVDLAYALESGHLPMESAGRSPAWIRSEGAESHWAALFARWLGALGAELPPPLRAPAYSLGLSLVDDASIAALNASWRGKEGATDVLAFAAQEDAPPPPPSKGSGSPVEPLELGDIVISLETAARQAEDAGETLERELLFLASHGLLHLLGWDHPDEPSLAAMLARQNDLLAHSGLPPDVSDDLCAGGFAG